MRKYHVQRDEARGLTTELCLLLALAVIGTIAISALAFTALSLGLSYAYLSATTTIKMPDDYWRNLVYERLLLSFVLTLIAVAGTALYRSWEMASGGGRCVARLLGGTRIIDADKEPAQTRVVNVVDELAIATGIKPPPVFVLKDEPGINAFAAGLNPKDTVIGVTQGAIDRLQRHQLQGVIAHEFSHIVNGDMRLNIQLLGVLTGVQAIAFAAQFLLRLGMPGRDAGKKNPLGMILALLFGVALWPIGQVGSLFAKLIQLAVNRQREFLADASAVQYTRDPHGLCEALAILLDDEAGSRLTSPGSRLASHMFFASGSGAWQLLFQSHPPVLERIRRLDPNLTTGRETLQVSA
jgi:Zn-dependent protease with chaperone function